MFAADLYDVAMGRAKPIYQDPAEFFALTYPTFNLRALAKEVALRLAGRSDRAIRQLALTYGGGKTHTLIALYHLTKDPARLPDLPAVHEFTNQIGFTPPQARIAVLAFDQLDTVTGMDVRAPDGAVGRFRMPWSALAFQLGGAEGLRILGTTGAEREEQPFTNVLEELLALPARRDEATLVLIDEVLMWARTKVGTDPVWRGRIQDFFQALTQAATKVDRCAIVASLLATDPARSDDLGKQITADLYAVFEREREEAVQPVLQQDVAEVLRRRFFSAESIRDSRAFRPHVVAALQGINALDEQTRRDGPSAEARYLASYPFHPDLTDIFYTRWTNLDNFQRTRGVLRTFALALRSAEAWDQSPLVAANVFLQPPGEEGISGAATELATTATAQPDGGAGQNWSAILGGELAKARGIQSQFPGLRYREVEQAVLVTFLSSQPVGQRALTRDLLVLLGHTRPDRIDLEQALRRWSEESWFLDEGELGEIEATTEGTRPMPTAWRLGRRPNLKQMHYGALPSVESLVESRLIEEIRKLRGLTAGASAAGATVHLLPDHPRDVEDDGDFHYVVLGPSAASDAGRPSAEARRYIEETTSRDRPRVRKNAVVIAAPSRDGAEAARGVVREYLGWIAVRDQLQGQPLDSVRSDLLAGFVKASLGKIPDAIRQCYCIVVALSARNEIEAFRITVEAKPLFELIKADARSRIKDTAVEADALLPGGPYDLWKGLTARRVKDLVGAFAETARLPKMLNRRAVMDTLLAGCAAGTLVLRLTRPDRSIRTFWRTTPDEVALADPSLEAILPEAATIVEVSPGLLAPRVLPGLWERDEISVRATVDYFSGNMVVKIPRDGYDEPLPIPGAERAVVEAAIESAIQSGKLWLTSGPASILSEPVPVGLLTDDAVLQAPPRPVPALDVVPDNAAVIWGGSATTGLAISAALSEKRGNTLPWITVRQGVDAAIQARLLERTPDSGPWPCDFAGAGEAKFRLPSTMPPPPPPPPPFTRLLGVRRGEAVFSVAEIQDLADVIGQVKTASAGHELKITVVIELGGKDAPTDEAVAKVNELLAKVSPTLKLR
jgi:hypothetical protein